MIDGSLDTTALVDILRGNRRVEKVLNSFTDLGLSHVVLGEMLLGTLKSANPAGELQKVLGLVRDMTLLNADSMTATIYAQIRHDLEKQGMSIPQNDLWIAAITIQADVPLITRDPHFHRIQKLKVLDYAAGT